MGDAAKSKTRQPNCQVGADAPSAVRTVVLSMFEVVMEQEHIDSLSEFGLLLQEADT